jgi:hypothetical protein
MSGVNEFDLDSILEDLETINPNIDAGQISLILAAVSGVIVSIIYALKHIRHSECLKICECDQENNNISEV